MKRRTATEATGVKGTCPCCRKPTFIARGTLTGEVAGTGMWIAKKELIDEIAMSIWHAYQEKVSRRLVPKTAEDGTVTQEIEEEKTPVVRCHACSTPTQKLFWLAIAGQGVAGPFCRSCAKHNSKNSVDEEGHAVIDPLVYIVNVEGALQTVMAIAQDIRKAWGLQTKEISDSEDSETTPF